MEKHITPDERADRIAGLLDRIEHLNDVIAQRRAEPEPDTVSAREFSARRDKYVHELNQLLWTVGLTGELTIPRKAA
jgi:hypothetical protein